VEDNLLDLTRGGGDLDPRRWISTRLGLLLALSLLWWSEGDVARSGAVFFNKSAAVGSSLSLGSEDEVPLASRGGEVGFLRGAARYATALLLAGLGGEEELKRGVLILDRGRGSCPL
jgi:hypothetical protein